MIQEDLPTLELPSDLINPAHYKLHPSGIECIEITRHMSFNLGNAIKYIWRAGLKYGDPIPDLQKALWYISDEIGRMSVATEEASSHEKTES